MQQLFKALPAGTSVGMVFIVNLLSNRGKPNLALCRELRQSGHGALPVRLGESETVTQHFDNGDFEEAQLPDPALD